MARVNSSGGIMGGGVIMYGGSPIYTPFNPLQPPPFDPLQPLIPSDGAEAVKKFLEKIEELKRISPCEKCKRHISKLAECPFCYADSLTPEEVRKARERSIEKIQQVHKKFEEISARMEKREAENAKDRKALDALRIELHDVLKETP